ncbi:hypothetical protein C7T35_01255 [Variovorax sp. WS11]|uniref:hypothetical protein n=1 Tax=Variovorax sp. WS11 TaxID=1105204 RepID=UPI000D0DADA2|nr:hypothetical protein [Variovorax sp. WS11]NDZ11521.1 hypothetical protein [Variovorax sp. WS11]PSL86624.1 hypothetical protein C7T35_01255 [Variovorax sp. WS11]
MSHVTHEFPRAYEAATKVDPLILDQALDHIARTAARSRSQTRRLRWIEQRALIALRGDEFRDLDIELPKSAGPDTHEKLQRRMAYHIAVKHEMLEALQALHANMLAQGLEDEAKRPTEDEFQQCMRQAAAAIAKGGEA